VDVLTQQLASVQVRRRLGHTPAARAGVRDVMMMHSLVI
jgi:hypothetical protein